MTTKKKEWRKEPRKVKINLDSKIGKYYVNRKRGMNKTKAQLEAGFPDGMHASRIENTKTYKEIDKVFYKEALMARISLGELAEEHLKNIRQDVDRGAKHRAIEMALDRIEPDKTQRDEEKVLVVLKEAIIKEAEISEPDEVIIK
jgi:hypothetical protein